MDKNGYMLEALKEAEKAYKKGEVPVGAVIVRRNEIIARGHNLRETGKSPLAHAEIIAIGRAAEKLGGWRLTESQIYVTIEPCAMCAGAILQARIDEVFIGAMDPKAGAAGSVYNLLEDGLLYHFPKVEKGILESECSGIMKSFFRELRKNK
jgi:tRNA(adenine34) deaminase